MLVELTPKLLHFTKLCGYLALFTPTIQYFYTDISAISVTFCNSAHTIEETATICSENLCLLAKEIFLPELVEL